MAGAMKTESVFDKNEVYVGRDFGGAEYEITPDLVALYIAGTGDDNPWYRDSSPLGGPVAPALIVHRRCSIHKTGTCPTSTETCTRARNSTFSRQ
jgi:hypothetical protein